MIFDFETLFLGQKIEFRENQRHRWIGELLAHQSELSNFCRGAELVKIKKMKSKLLNHQKVMILRPLENLPESRRKNVRLNEFFEENNCRNKI